MGWVPSLIKKHEHSLQHCLRTAHFLPQSLIAGILLHRDLKKDPQEVAPLALAPLLKRLWELFERDEDHIARNLYLAPERILPHYKEYLPTTLKTLLDLFRVRKRMETKDVSLFPQNSRPKDIPSYYAQTFHFQSNGYLSEESAELYDHQVEMVFLGSAQVMRRQALIPLAHYFSQNAIAAPKVLDVACGTGLFTHEIQRNFPDAKITGVDLSPWYLKKAAKDYPQIEWLQANAENLPFADASFDVVTSIYLYHELPEKVREKISAELLRVLKPGGQLVFVDSIQWNDDPSLNGSLQIFPKLYYEPYFQNYIQHPVEAYFKGAAAEGSFTVSTALFSKILSLTKKA
jgi:ubiquinone/menaquinone biosynthesis C-methylase UbiE